MFPVVYEISLGELSGATLNISASLNARPGTFRLIDCLQLVRHATLKIYEMEYPPTVAYATISYVWRGVGIEPSLDYNPGSHHKLTIPEKYDPSNEFSVRGAEDGDPIGVAVLHDACSASLRFDAPYLWLDRLCILQMSREDKAWQIARMQHIYQSSVVALILPGGIRRLVGMDEETAWIHRAWTLQEALCPPRAVVLYYWTLGSGFWQYTADLQCTVEEVVPGRAVISPLLDMLYGSLNGLMHGKSTSGVEWPVYSVYPAIFGAADPATLAMRGVLTGIVTLIAALELTDQPEMRAQAIWRSAFLRTSTRPVDMVFSIMGLFGVTLDIRKFHRDDRLGATVALAREILRQGGSAAWLGVSFYLLPSVQLSSFPTFPETNVSGRAYVQTASGLREASEVMNGWTEFGWWLRGDLKGSMDDNGYLSLKARAAPVTFTGTHQEFEEGRDNMTVTNLVLDIDGGVWRIEDSASTRTAGMCQFIVFLGMQEPLALRSKPRWHIGWSVRAVVIEEHAPERFHRTVCFIMGDAFQEVIKTRWELRTIQIGGPNAINPSP